MPNPNRTQQMPLPPEFLLPIVAAETVDQFDQEDHPLPASLDEFTTTNFELVQWLRLEATRLFPDDLESRERALKLALGALSLEQSQQLKNVLIQRFAPELPPRSGVVPPAA